MMAVAQMNPSESFGCLNMTAMDCKPLCKQANSGVAWPGTGSNMALEPQKVLPKHCATNSNRVRHGSTLQHCKATQWYLFQPGPLEPPF